MSLVIRRKEGERVRIARDIWVRVSKIGRKTVVLQIEAGPDVEILREELIEPNTGGGENHVEQR